VTEGLFRDSPSHQKEQNVNHRINSFVRALALFAVAALMASPAAAQASRTWVSGVGDDANPCSRTAPCKTFAGAISKTAPGGEIDALDPGGYGAVTITKALTIDGGGGQVASVLVSGTNGIVVQAGANDQIILRNLRINGIGTGINGIRFLAGKSLSVENCYIFGFTTNGIDVALNQAGTASVQVSNSVIENNAGSGIRTSNAAAAFVRTTLTNDVFHRNGTGVTAADNSLMFAMDSHVANSTSNGWVAQPVGATASQITLEQCSSSNNGGAGAVSSGGLAIVRFDNSIMDHNAGAGISAAAGGQLLTFGNNRSVANGGGDGAATGTAVTVF
jgi:hypothetical protein